MPGRVGEILFTSVENCCPPVLSDVQSSKDHSPHGVDTRRLAAPDLSSPSFLDGSAFQGASPDSLNGPSCPVLLAK